MDLTIACKPNPLLFSSALPTQTITSPLFFKLPKKYGPKYSHQKPLFRVQAARNSNGSGGFSWSSLVRSVQRGSFQFWTNFTDSMKEDTGFDIEDVNEKVGEFIGRVREGVKMNRNKLESFKNDALPEFVSWNRWECWKVIPLVCFCSNFLLDYCLNFFSFVM